MSKPLVSVIIPNWNGVELLKLSLPSLEKQSFKSLEIIIVDNGSTDNSIKYINDTFPKVKVIKLERNYGFAKAVNIGIKKTNGKYIIFLNNDTEIDKSCIQYLVQAVLRKSNVGFIQAKSLNFKKRNIIDNASDTIDAVGHLKTYGLGENDGPKFRSAGYIFLASGNGTLFKREVFDQVGLFDEDYFFYMEDADFCLRAQLKGFKGWFEPKAKIYHLRGATSSKNPQFFDCQVFRNMTMTIIKDFPNKLLLKDFNLLKIILVHLNTIKYLFSKGYFFSVLKSEWDIVRSLGKLLKKRKEIQSSKIVDDQYIIENIAPKNFLPKLY
ncbi:glycosyltransferase family 2 protein [Candidatus Microgenomates bacterium]|nr:glycosyltransferase family 2 protein [Candidatus Microgenomates bacterium]